MSENLQHEGQFVAECMYHLKAATEYLTSSTEGIMDEAPLLYIQRALLLLKTHMETFRKRYAYHLRRWALEGESVSSHAAALEDRNCTPIRFMVQPAAMSERCVLDLLSTDYVADLRAEIMKWWENLCKINNSEGGSNSNKSITLQEGSIRIITLGQELLMENDEKTLGEMGFKENQVPLQRF